MAEIKDLLRSVLVASGAATIAAKVGARADADPERPTKLTPSQEAALKDLEEKANSDLMTPQGKERLLRLRKLKKAYSDSAKTDADPKKPVNGDYGTKYTASAVQKEIEKDKRIKPAEAKAIHAVLKGWRGDEAKADGFDSWSVDVSNGSDRKTIKVKARNVDDAKRFALERLGDAAAGKWKATGAAKADGETMKDGYKAEMDRYHALSKKATNATDREKYEDLAEKFRQKMIKAGVEWNGESARRRVGGTMGS